MPTMCVQCAMRALLNDEPPTLFDQEPEAHRRQFHPDPVATQIEREELERQLKQKLWSK